MLGWWIAIDEGTPQELDALPRGEIRERTLASWETGVSGLRWIKALESDGKALFDANGSNGGYPDRYSAPAAALAPFLANLTDQPGDAGWIRVQHLHKDRINTLDPSGILTVTAFDQS